MNIIKKMKQVFGFEKPEIDITTPYGMVIDRMERYQRIIMMYAGSDAPGFTKKSESVGRLHNIITTIATLSYKGHTFQLKRLPLSITLSVQCDGEWIRLAHFHAKKDKVIHWTYDDTVVGEIGRDFFENFPEIAHESYVFYLWNIKDKLNQ